MKFLTVFLLAIFSIMLISGCASEVKQVEDEGGKITAPDVKPGVKSPEPVLPKPVVKGPVEVANDVFKDNLQKSVDELTQIEEALIR